MMDMFSQRIILSSIWPLWLLCKLPWKGTKKKFSHPLLGYLLLLTEVKKYTWGNCLWLLSDKENAITSFYKQETIFRLSI